MNKLFRKVNTRLLLFYLAISITFLINCKTEPKKILINNISETSTIINQMRTDSIFKFFYDAIVVDSHNDFVYQVYNKGASFDKKDKFTQTGLPRLLEGGVDVQVFAVWIPKNEYPRAMSFVKEQVNRIKNFEINSPDKFEIAKTYDDILRITGNHKLCGLMGIEDGIEIESLEDIESLYSLGIRYIGLLWNNNNKIGSSAKEESKGKKGGLTNFGKKVIEKMNEIGMIIDVSHMGEQSFWDVISLTKYPIIASHSNCYSLNPHYRNLKDEQIKAIAKIGGVIMVNFYDEFISPNAEAKRSQNFYEMYRKQLDSIYLLYENDLIKFNEERYKFILEHPINYGTSIDKLIDHIDYIKNLVGVDYIGLGSDFDGGITPPNELYDGTCYPIIAKKLSERGYSKDEIRKILGENFLRVFKNVTEKQ
jgi:membrane dipeptidase